MELTPEEQAVLGAARRIVSIIGAHPARHAIEPPKRGG